MHYRFPSLSKIQQWLDRQSVIIWAMLAVVVLSLPALFSGLAWDDYFIRAVVLQNTGISGVPQSPFDAFKFHQKDPSRIKQGIDAGLYPWWIHPQHTIAFFRPLSSLTHWLDFKLFPDSAWLMHVHNIAWYALLVFVTGLLYRRFLFPIWVAGLATFIYALDDGHAIGAASLCSRNSVITAVFGFLTLLAHDRWRNNGSNLCKVLAPCCFILGLLSGESAIATGGYLLAYAVFLDQAKPGTRLAALLPYIIAGTVWRIIYTTTGYGVAYSGTYLDPGKDVFRFLVMIVQRMPVLLLGQLALPYADLWPLLPSLLAQVYVVFALVFTIFVAWVIWPLLKRDSTVCFWALGMILSTIPFCATLPGNRFLYFTSLGSMGIIARFFATALEQPAWFMPHWKKPQQILAYVWVVIHVVISPLMFAPATLSPFLLQKPLTLAAETIIPQQHESPPRRTVVVNVPSDLMMPYLPFIRAAYGKSINLNSFLLSAGLTTVEVQRIDERTLVIRLKDGLLEGSWDRFFRDPTTPVEKGFRLQLSDLSIEVTGVTEKGLPAEIRYEFTVPLEDASLRWVTWSEHGFIPFAVPSPGETVSVKPLSLFWPLKILNTPIN